MNLWFIPYIKAESSGFFKKFDFKFSTDIYVLEGLNTILLILENVSLWISLYMTQFL